MTDSLTVVPEAALAVPADLLALVAPSALLLVALPDHVNPVPLREGIVAAMEESPRSLLVGPGEPPRSCRSLPLGAFTSAAAALKALKASGRPHTAVVDFTQDLPPWASLPGQAEGFLAKASAALAGTHSRTILIVAHRFLSEKAWIAMRNRANLTLMVSSAGPWLYAQLLAPQGDLAPMLSLPRPLKLLEHSFRLGRPAIPRSDRESEQSDAMLDLYRNAFQGSGDGIVLFDPTGGFQEANDRALEMLGRTREEFSAVALKDMVTEAAYPAMLRALAETRRKRRSVFDAELQRKSGRPAAVNVVIAPIGARLAVATIRDASGDKRRMVEQVQTVEELQARLRATPLPQAVFVSRKLRDANPVFREIFASSLSGEAEPTLQQLLGRDLVAVAHEMQRVTEDRGPSEKELHDVPLPGGEGKTRRFHFHADRLLVEGKKGFLLTLVETTESFERIRSLEETASTLRSLVDTDAAPTTVVRDGIVLWANRGYVSIVGLFSSEDVRGKEVAQYLAVRDRKNVPAKLGAEGMESGDVATFEYTALSSQGKPVRVEAITQPIEFEGKRAGLAIHRPVTGKNKSTEELRERIDEAQRLDKIAAACRHVLEPLAFSAAALEASCRFLGFDAGVVYGVGHKAKGLEFLASSNLPETVLAALRDQSLDEGVTGFVARTHEPLIMTMAEYPAHLPYKSLFESAGYGTVIYLPLIIEETLQGILLLCTQKALDPTSLRPEFLSSLSHSLGSGMSVAVRFNTQKLDADVYRGIVESTPDIPYRIGPTGRFEVLPPQVSALLGHEAADFLRDPDLWRNSIHPDDRTLYSQKFSGEARGTLMYRILPVRKAAYRRVRDAYACRRDAEGKLLSIDGVVADLGGEDERPQVQESPNLEVFESVQEGVAILDGELHVKIWNAAMEEATGHERAAVVEKRIPVDDEQPVCMALAEAARRALEGEVVDIQDLSAPDQLVVRTYWLRCSPVRDTDGAISGVICTLSDVSRRTRLEKELASSESMLRTVIDSMGDALMITDLQGKIADVNGEFTRITGYGRHEVLGLTLPYPWLHDEEMGNIVAWISALREKEDLRDFDMTWTGKEGHPIAISLNTTLLRNSMGEPIAMLNIARNISERAALAEELAAKSSQIEMLNRIISTANETLDVRAVFDVAAAEIARMIRCDVITLSLLSQDKRSVTVHACSFPSGADGVSPGTSWPIERTNAGRAVSSAEAAVIEDLVASGMTAELLLPVKNARSLVSIPLLLNDRVLGTLDLASCEAGSPSSRDLALLQLIADQLGPALQNAILYTELQSQIERIKALYELGEGLAGAVDAGTILIRMAEQAARTVTFDRLIYASIAEESELRVTSAFSGEGMHAQQSEVTDADKGSVRELQAFLMQGMGVIEEKPVRMSVIVRGRERIHGTTMLTRAGSQPYHEADLRLLESIATLTGIALDRALFYEDTLTKSEEIRARNRDLDDFTYVVSHDLKEPLITIEGYCTIIERDFGKNLDPEMLTYFKSSVQAVNRMKRLIDDLLVLSRLGRGASDRESVSMRTVIESVLSDLDYRLKERHADVHLPGLLPTVRYNPTQLGLVFRNLLTNGIKFNKDEHPELTIDVSEGVNEYIVSVRDNGIGIAPEYFDRIFVIFQRLHPAGEYPGTGVGLTIVKKIIERHRGRIWVESVPGRGTTVSFTIPM